MNVLRILVLMGICMVSITGCLKNTKLTAKERLSNYKADDWFTNKNEIEFCRLIERSDTEKMGEMLSDGLDINKLGKVNSNQITFLAWAFAKQNKIGYRYLLEHGANPNIVCMDEEIWGAGTKVLVQFSVLGLAAMHAKDPFYLTVALKHGGNPNAVVGKVSIMTSAIDAKSLTNIQLLIEAGADVDGKYGGSNPLYSAIIGESYDIVYYLLEKGANPDIGNIIPDIKDWYLADIEPNKLTEEARKQAEWRLKVIKLLEAKGYKFEIKDE